MKTNEVTALRKNIRSDASPQIAGFLYQFVVALDHCFQLNPGQSLYIEKYGDIAIKGDGSYDEAFKDTSVEVKMYADDLDVSHHNLLNTLYNWLEDDFKFESYQTLILYTTQSFSKDSLLIGWNEMTGEKRAKIVTDAYTKYLAVNKEKIEDKNSKSYTTIKTNAQQMRCVLGSMQNIDGKSDEKTKSRLEKLLDRVSIYDSCKNLEHAYKDLQKYAKVVNENLREVFIDSLLGFVVIPKNMKDGWKIEEADFTKMYQILSEEMSPRKFLFPDAPDVSIKEGEYDDSLFLYKLKEIDYDKITDAVIDFAKTTGLLAKEFERPSAEKNLSDYLDELHQIYDLKQGNAVDELAKCVEVTNESLKNASRQFLRDMLYAARFPEFSPYGRTKPFFSNGMCHYMANDSTMDVKWLLK